MQRTPHDLTKPQHAALPKQIVLLNASLTPQADEFEPRKTLKTVSGVVAVRLRMRGGRLFRVDEYAAASPGELWEWLERITIPGTMTWVFMLGAYEQLTALGLWSILESGRLELHGHDIMDPPEAANGKARKWAGICVLENPPFIVQARFKMKSGHVKFLDVRNYGVQSWQELLHGSAYAEVAYWESAVTFQAATIEGTVKVDAMERWLESYLTVLAENGLGGLENTISSQAYYSWRFKYLDRQVNIHCVESVLLLERSALVGGRCECRFLGHVIIDQGPLAAAHAEHHEGPVRPEVGGLVQLDVNSMYLHAASYALLPTALVGWDDKPDSLFEHWQDGKTVAVADVTLDTPEPVYPWRHDKQVYYPTGKFRTVLAGQELTHALDHGRILRSHAAAYYQASDFLRPWSLDMFSLKDRYKRENNRAMAATVKSLGVALFGKFGQLGRRWVDDPKEPAAYPYCFWHAADDDHAEPVAWRAVNWRSQRQECEPYTRESFAAVAACVNAAARLYLWRLMETAGQANVYYYDTDSLWVNMMGLDNLNRAGLVRADQLGFLKEVDRYRHVEFNGIKRYTADGRRVFAGLPHDAQWSGRHRYYMAMQEPINTALHATRQPLPVDVVLQWSAIGGYRHGKVDRQGKVTPFHLSHDDAEQ